MTPSTASYTIVLLLAVAMYWTMFSLKNKWNPDRKFCYVTGGSSGLGLELAKKLVKKGADVSIVARGEERLKDALAMLEEARQSASQVITAHSFSLDNATASSAALDAACASHGGRVPDAVFLCAGASTPKFFVDLDEASMKKGMDDAYWVQAWSALAACKRMVRDRTTGKIVFVSSVLGYMSFVGYSSYSPGKHALRGLAESLRSELLLYSIDVHIYFPATIFTPGYVEENKTKPQITLKIEENDPGLQPESCATHLLRGVQSGHFHITGDFITQVFRCSTRGATPHNSVFLDTIYGLIGWIALPFWRRSVDKLVQAHHDEHDSYLNDQRKTL